MILSKEDGVETSVVDLRTLLPLDRELIIESVQGHGQGADRARSHPDGGDRR